MQSGLSGRMRRLERQRPEAVRWAALAALSSTYAVGSTSQIVAAGWMDASIIQLVMLFSVLGVALVQALLLRHRLPCLLWPCALLMLGGSAMVLGPTIGSSASSGGLSGTDGWLGLALAIVTMVMTVANFVILQASRHLGFTATQLQFCYLPLAILALLPLSLPIDGTNWSANFSGWDAGWWAILVVNGALVYLGGNFALQNATWALGAPLVSMLYGLRLVFAIAEQKLVLGRTVLGRSKRRLSVEETVDKKLVLSGARDELKQLARARLEESGWTDEVRQLCREFVAREGADGVRHEQIVAAVKPAARQKVPDNLKAELLKRDSSAASSTARAFLVSEGPPVRLIRSSLDGSMTALHRSARLVECHCHATGCMFVEAAGADKQGRKSAEVQLLGFFWTASQLVMVTGAGLELHSVHPSRQALRLDATLPLQGVQWYVYSPQTQMVVLGSGSNGAKLQAIQFSRTGVLRLPLLDLTPPWGSPIRPGVAAAISTALDGFSAARDQPPRLVGPDTCWVVVLYGRVFCCHHDRRAAVLRLYRLFRDATSLAHTFDVFAQQLELSVVDNVLVVHHIDSAVCMLIDIMDGSGSPLTAGGEAAAAAPAAAYALHFPWWLVDTAGGIVYRLQLDLRAIADSQSDFCRLLAFLQRRRAAAAPRRDAAAISLRALRTMAAEEPPLRALRQAFDIVNSCAVGGNARQQQQVGSRVPSGTSSAASSGRASPLPAGPGGTAGGTGAASPSPAAAAAAQQLGPVVLPQDLHDSVFAPLHAQRRCRPAYLQAALCEYLASCDIHGLAPCPSLAALLVDVLLEQGLSHAVAPLLLALPQLDSVLLAEHLEEADASGRLPGGTHLAQQLLQRLGAQNARCRLLLRHGHARQALLLARQQGLLSQFAADALLDAAAAGGDALLLAAAHRICAAPANAGGLVQAARSRKGSFQPAQLDALLAAA
ncbi:colon cancer-associated Mic1 [Chlorella sorokiniana]|uniref:Transcription and mRNA export factor ENY2 n=1 Tax=Chlorella sorokiniana TaxID=3076 RepID=A0A2P6TYV3_CHLSO|nr:colon cancer-associated Mic1 [Chlorella sorokiniana]|eukprot:PRW59246.1 colon cancer-associated Mic1 [Chlorella sorokiniana]